MVDQIKIPIDENQPLVPGDKIEIVFDLFGGGLWLRAIQVAQIESNLKKKHPEWNTYSIIDNAGINGTDYIVRIEVIPWEQIPVEDRPTYTATILTPAVIAALIIGGIVTLGVSYTIYKVYGPATVIAETEHDKVLSETLGGQIKLALSGITFKHVIAAGVVFGILAAVGVLKK